MTENGSDSANTGNSSPGVNNSSLGQVPGLEGLPVWDRDVMLERVLNDEDLLAMVRDAYLSDMPVQIAELKNLITSEDVDGVTRQAHTIKGASANVCAERMRGVGLWMETAAKGGDLAGVADKLAQLERELELVKKAMGK